MRKSAEEQGYARYGNQCADDLSYRDSLMVDERIPEICLWTENDISLTFVLNVICQEGKTPNYIYFLEVF